MAIDLATGNVHITRDDVLLPGRVPLSWQRGYGTALLGARPTPLGDGWMSKYFAALTVVGASYEFFTPDGGVELFMDPGGAISRGEAVRNLGSFQELAWFRGRFVVTRWDVDSGDIERLIFSHDAGGGRYLLGAVENVTGEGLDLLRDEAGRLVGVRQRAEMRTLVLEYDAAGRITSGRLTSPLARSAELFRYEYDPYGRLVADYDAAGFGDRYEYDRDSRLVRQVSRDGGVFSYRYDRDGRCIRYSGLDRYDEKTLRYSPAVRSTELTDSHGRKTVFHFLPTGQVVRQVDPLGRETSFEYDELGRMTGHTSPGGATTTYRYDGYGNRVEIRNAVGGSHLFTYNAFHLPVLLVDPNGQPWRREYDDANRLVASYDPNGAAWRLRHDEQGNTTAIVDPEGATLRQRFDNGQVTAATDWLGNWTEYQYDAMGNITEVVHPDGSTAHFTYDELNRVLQARLPDALTYSYTYDAGSNVTSMADSYGQTIVFRYGPCARLLERVDGTGNSLRFIWGTEPGDLQVVVNERGERYTFERDDAGRSVREVSFDGRVNLFGYDADGRLTRFVNGEDEVVEFDRDPLGRVIKKQLPDGAVYGYRYDPAGDLVAATSPDVALLVERDSKGRITREIQGENWVESAYNVRGDVVRTRTSLGYEIAVQFDANRRIARLRTQSGAEMGFERDVVGNETARALPGDGRITMGYDPLRRLTVQTVAPLSQRPQAASAPTREVVERIYRYGSQLSAVNDSRWGSTSYVYDAAQRVIEVNRTPGGSERLDYDETTNCVAIRNPQGEEVLTYLAGNRITSKDGTRYDFDGQGRLVQKTVGASTADPKVWRFRWDALDQLRAVEAPSGIEYRYEYDALGRRVAKIGPAGRIGFLWDKEVILQELHPGRPGVAWIMDPGGFAPLAQVREGQLYPIVTDHLGTPREMLGPDGRLVWAASYTVFGAVEQAQVFEDGVDCAVRFPGQWSDEETRLHYNYFRYYDPERGAFISQDPVGWQGGSNLYLYAKNPANWIDPFGLTCVNYKGRDGKGYVIYHITDGKKPPQILYVGITERGRFNERRDEHTQSGRLSGTRQMVPADHAATYGQARGYEQAHIEHHQTLNTSGRGENPAQYPGNRVRSYDPARLNDPSDTRADTFDGHYQDKIAELDS